MSTKTIVRLAPTVEPITLSEAKAQLRIEDAFTLDDTYITSLIGMARDRAENYCNRFFSEQQITILYDGPFPNVIQLPYPDLSSIDSVQYTDSSYVLQTVTPADYVVDLDRQTITTIVGWDTALDYRVNATTAAPVLLDGVLIAMLMMIADMYELRTESIQGMTINENPAVLSSIYPYRVELGI
jgi:uncharacterized phiE125 gp8 family phage protein